MSEGSAHAVFQGLSHLGCDMLFQSVLIASFCFLTWIYTLDKTAMADTCFQESSPRSDPSLVLKFHCFPKTSKTTYRLFLKEKCCFWRSLAGEMTSSTPMFPHLNIQVWTVAQNKTPVSGVVYPFASWWNSTCLVTETSVLRGAFTRSVQWPGWYLFNHLYTSKLLITKCNYYEKEDLGLMNPF